MSAEGSFSKSEARILCLARKFFAKSRAGYEGDWCYQKHEAPNVRTVVLENTLEFCFSQNLLAPENN